MFGKDIVYAIQLLLRMCAIFSIDDDGVDVVSRPHIMEPADENKTMIMPSVIPRGLVRS